MTTKALMIQGTASHVGKSLIVAALCRMLAQRGLRVAPFKAQNMSLNSYATPDGREIARAQALQALAAGVEPEAEMNPILLKPKGGALSQVVLLGRPYADLSAREYYSSFAPKTGWSVVKEALERLMKRYDVVIIEGAGSPAEINLHKWEIANMRVAEYAKAPVVLVADIDRGGAFASIVGTMRLLKPRHRKLVAGYLLNKFRGDLEILRPAMDAVERYTGKRFFGVIPYVEGLFLPAEDSVSLEEPTSAPGEVDVAVVRLPKISNFTDFDPLGLVEDVSVRFVRSPSELGCPDLVILPGTKNTVQDLRWLWESGFAKELIEIAHSGTCLIGICGGYQMIGHKVVDETGVEGGTPCSLEGLGLLDAETRFSEYSKITRRVWAEVVANHPMTSMALGEVISGYEIHMGKTFVGAEAEPLLKLVGQNRLDGAVSKELNVLGTYLHGLFDDPPLRNSVLSYIAFKKKRALRASSLESVRSAWLSSLDRFCRVFVESVDIQELLRLVGIES